VLSEVVSVDSQPVSLAESNETLEMSADASLPFRRLSPKVHPKAE
jgi:hypothetical protein